MANYANIKDTINQNIKTNGNQQITGQVLQNVLNAIVDNLTAGYLLVGIAIEDGNPGTPDQNVCWLATKGTYANYGNITVESGKLAVIKYNGTWTSDTVDVQGAVSAGDGINISETGAVSVKTGTGVKIDEEGNVAADLVAGDYISIEGNKISCTLDANPFYFVDVLPDSPVPGTENKVYVVPDTASTALNLYQWNAETSQFDLVGTIDLVIDTSNFIKKGKNDITEPLELDFESTPAFNAFGAFLLLNKNGAIAGIGLGTGKKMSWGNMSQLQHIKKTDGTIELALKTGLSSLALSQDGKLRLNAANTMQSMPIRPTFYIECPSGESWDNPNSTFSISGIYNKLKLLLDINAEVVLTYPSGQVVIGTDLQSFGDGQDLVFTYRFSSRRFTLTIKSDDSITIFPAAYIWRFNAADYGINAWYNASGKNQTLYKDLSNLIDGDSNKNGILGYLCDNNNTFVITGINITTSDSITILNVSFTEADSQRQDTLIIDSSGAFSVRRWPKLKVLWADDYNLIASGMPRPDAWLVADGTDVSFYDEVSDAYKYGYQLILKEYSYGSSSCNQYTVKNIIPGGTGYSLFYESGGRQYMLTINSDGSIITDCNVVKGSDFGANFAVTTVGKTSIDLANRLKRLYNARMRIVLEQDTYKFCVDVINQDTASGTLNLVYSVFLVINDKIMVSKFGMIINYNNGNYSISTTTNA